MGRILAIDYGTKRTGIAVSDPLRIIAGGLDTVETYKLTAFLRDYISRNEVDIIVVGKPMQTTGEPSTTYKKTVELVTNLSRSYPTIKIVHFDERYTSTLAHRAMLEGGMKKSQRRDKAAVDKISATILLQGFMESLEYQQMG